MNISKSEINKLNQLAEGGEGIIYEYGSDILKTYKSHVNISSKEKKVNALLKKSLPREVVVPKEAVYCNGKFIGYIMPRVEGDEIKTFTNKKFLTANSITTKDILGVLDSVIATVNVLHKEGIIIGDLNDQNILVDKQKNIHFIDCDSWTIGTEKCDVIMDLYRDPFLKGNDFTVETDTYALSILIWKTLTRIHPHGGTMNPDMDITERMRLGISVIDNPKVKIPRTIKSWANLNPELVSTLKTVFENKDRTIHDELHEMYSNLKFCDKDQDFYYGKFNQCPLCSKDAKVVIKPISQGSVGGIMLYSLLEGSLIKVVINNKIYINTSNMITDLDGKSYEPYIQGIRYHFFDACGRKSLIKEYDDYFEFDTDRTYRIPKKHRTSIQVDKNKVWYMSGKNILTTMEITSSGNGLKTILHTGYEAYFDCYGEHYCVINRYDEKLIITADGYNIEIPYNDKVIGYGLHYDSVTDKWFVVLDSASGKTKTYVVKHSIEFSTDAIKYEGSLSNLCFAGNTLYIPIDGKIRGYNYQKQMFKDFDCGVVSPDSKLIKKNNSFIIVNDENIYKLGK